VIKPQIKNRGETNLFSDSLSIAFNILERAISDSISAVYLKESMVTDFILHRTSQGKAAFPKIIQQSIVSKYIDETGNLRGSSPGYIQPDDTGHFFESSSSSMIRLHGLVADDELKGIMIVTYEHEVAHADKFIELAAQIVQNNLVLESQFDLIYADNAFLSDLVNRASELDLSSTSETIISALIGLAKSVLSFDRLTISFPQTQACWYACRNLLFSKGAVHCRYLS